MSTPPVSYAEVRTLNRFCRCGAPADAEARDCGWHPAVSAQYAKDLQRELISARAETRVTADASEEPTGDGTQMRWMGTDAEKWTQVAEDLTEAIRWRQVADDLAEAIRLTREYVGDAMLPAVPGWSWFDATNAYLRASGRPLIERDAPLQPNRQPTATEAVDAVIAPLTLAQILDQVGMALVRTNRAGTPNYSVGIAMIAASEDDLAVPPKPAGVAHKIGGMTIDVGHGPPVVGVQVMTQEQVDAAEAARHTDIFDRIRKAQATVLRVFAQHLTEGDEYDSARKAWRRETGAAPNKRTLNRRRLGHYEGWHANREHVARMLIEFTAILDGKDATGG